MLIVKRKGLVVLPNLYWLFAHAEAKATTDPLTGQTTKLCLMVPRGMKGSFHIGTLISMRTKIIALRLD